MTKLSRRSLFALPALGLAQTPALRKPKALKEGDTVSVIMPSTHTPDPELIEIVKRTVDHFGLKLKPGKYLGKRTASFEQSIAERVEDLHNAFRDPEVKAVMPIRGGYGTMQILDSIDYSIVRDNPKIFTGYSDITAMHLAFHKFAGLLTFHSPIVLSPFTKYTQEQFRKALFDTKPIGAIGNPVEANPFRPSHAWRTIVPGKARGPLMGGNLTLVCNTMGTRYEIDTKGKILFLEDIAEEPYKLDRMLTQLWLAGKLQQAAGIVWGECSDCGPAAFKPSQASPFTVAETVQNIFSRLKMPVFGGLTFGHTADQATIPYGLMATLDADKGTVTVEESATV